MITKKENLDYIVKALMDIADELDTNFSKQPFSDIEPFLYNIYKSLYELADYIERRCY